MSDEIMVNNQVTVTGKIIDDFKFSHEIFGESFYTINISVSRLSDSYDTIPVLVSDRLVDISSGLIGKYVRAAGQFRSYNRHDRGKNHLILSVFAREFSISDESCKEQLNAVDLTGFICKPVIYRKTPLGREIADLLIAVNRPYGKSDYIPCISWGRNAKFSKNLAVGEHIHISGRIQSRIYTKKTDNNESVEKVALEVSISSLEADSAAQGSD
jgi:primosomal replication protein N